MVFGEVDLYSYNKGKYLNFDPVGQDYAATVYPCDSMALYVYVPDTSLIFHSERAAKPRLGLIPEAIACNSQRSGYAGTRELVDKIYVSSNYDFDETHGRNDN